MTAPPLAALSYEAWIVRRTSADGLRILYTAVALGAGEVLVPLPWPEARLLEEDLGAAITCSAWSRRRASSDPPQRRRTGRCTRRAATPRSAGERQVIRQVFNSCKKSGGL